jgi:protein-S-isoprenylcysteine O-methyltransferase Ste14
MTMMSENVFLRIGLLALYLMLLAIWLYFQRRAGAYDDGMRQHGRAQRRHETGRLLLLRPLLGLPEHTGILLWLAMPSLMAWSAIALPEWLRWSGIGLGALALLLLGWSMQALGPNFVAALGLRGQHTLVTRGPYRFLRHPMYVGFLLLQLAMALVTANWFIGFTGIGLILAVIVDRVGAEENKLAALFGETYRDYARRTGRFFPRLGG